MPSSTPAEPVVEEDRVCPECGSEHLVRDYARGELVCDSCGLVISEGAIDEGPEWSAYSVEENDRLARTGAPRSYVAGASGLTTVIPLA
ncbi:MAG: transcription initiation factor IIB, partial [Methanobacteriota archaeon]